MSIQQLSLTETPPKVTPNKGVHLCRDTTQRSLPLGCDNLIFQSEVNCARLIDVSDENEVRAYQTLRYECFVVRRGWVTGDAANPGLEIDHYDAYCHHLGVFQETQEGKQLVAYLRALPWQEQPGLMLQHEFCDLVSEEAVQGLAQTGNVEISRLVVAPLPGSSSSGRGESVALAELLFKLVYGLGKRLGWTAYYIVLEEAWLRVLNRRFGIPFVPLGAVHTYADGTRTLAAWARCEEMERAMLSALPDKYQWYQPESQE